MASDARIPVSEYVRRVPASLRPTLQAGRKTIKANAPKDTEETAWRTWPIRYSVDGMFVCGIGNYPRWVSVYFFRGADLDDPDGVLEGSGKGMRHVKLREPKDADATALKKLVRQAFKVGGTDMRGRTPSGSRRGSR
jgi:hypothetical protein